MKNLYFLGLLLFYWSSNAQVKHERQIIIVRTSSYNGSLLSPNLIFNDKDTIKIKYKSLILKKIESDSLIIKIPYLSGSLKKKIAVYPFSIKDPVTYLVFDYNWFESKPSLTKVLGEDLERLKQKKYVKIKIKEFGIE